REAGADPGRDAAARCDSRGLRLPSPLQRGLRPLQPGASRASGRRASLGGRLLALRGPGRGRAMSAPPLVEARSLTRTFELSRPWLDRALAGEGRRQLTAVSGASFSIGRGATLALVGESGSGKSTLARMTVGLLQPTAGRVTIDGIDMWAEADRSER